MEFSKRPVLQPPSVRLQEELRSTKDELVGVIESIKKMQKRKRELDEKISNIKSELKILAESENGASTYDHDEFPWSVKMNVKLSSVFGITSFRSYQKAAINATMSGLDCLLVMPTGGGKSLCFQLPAILCPGITLVVSPLISLMEDQLRALEDLNIPTALFNSNTTREMTKEIFASMINPSSALKLLYVTPEKLAKSKRLMSQLEKMYRAGRFSRLVIDEVHCCSQWGHDFRPDYKFLGIMKTQFPKTPIIGLTATATATVIADVQKILNVEGCLLFKDSFFRANLKYEVVTTDSKDKVEDIAKLINVRFPGQSGIIYCLTIKDCEDVAVKLEKMGLASERYHAQLEPEDRTSIQQRWYNNNVNVIVATVAFGMGINKLDVRYVIHYSMSKSVENYYQETGRAGRDGLPAYCILYYRFLDVFRATSLMFTEKNGTRNVYNMMTYSLNRDNCRKALIAQHFGDQWKQSSCDMCDNCDLISSPPKKILIEAGPLLNDLLKLIRHATKIEERMTPLKLMDAWFAKGVTKLRLANVPVPKYSRAICERIIAYLLIDGYLQEEFHFTPYSTISYLESGPKSQVQRDNKIPYEIVSDKSDSVKTLTSSTKRKASSSSRIYDSDEDFKMKSNSKSSSFSFSTSPTTSSSSHKKTKLSNSQLPSTSCLNAREAINLCDEYDCITLD